MCHIHWEFSSFCSALFRRVVHDELDDVRQVSVTACRGFHENVQKPMPACIAPAANVAGRGNRIMPCCEIKKGRFLSVLRIRPMHSALFRTRQNIPYAELGIMVIFTANRSRFLRNRRTFFHHTSILKNYLRDTPWLCFQSSSRMDFNSRRRFAVVLGYAILNPLSVSRTMRETIKRAFSLSSAGITNHGACSVLVAFRQSS